jgi:hypothetical protein
VLSQVLRRFRPVPIEHDVYIRNDAERPYAFSKLLVCSCIAVTRRYALQCRAWHFRSARVGIGGTPRLEKGGAVRLDGSVCIVTPRGAISINVPRGMFARAGARSAKRRPMEVTDA